MQLLGLNNHNILDTLPIKPPGFIAYDRTKEFSTLYTLFHKRQREFASFGTLHVLSTRRSLTFLGSVEEHR